jgi:hypothetical protein
MSSKKKKPVTKVSAEPVIEQPIDPTPQDDVPTIQIEEVQDTEPEPIEQPAEPEPVAETAPIVEPVAQVKEAEPEKSADAEHVELTPIPHIKPKPITLVSLHAELEELRTIVDQQVIQIKLMMAPPLRLRNPPLSTNKVQIKDTLTGKIYPSKNATYQTLLKAGELEDLVKQGVFGSDPVKNSFGCYNLFRAYPNRFVEVKPEEIKV